jgi:hypothetical protein
MRAVAYGSMAAAVVLAGWWIAAGTGAPHRLEPAVNVLALLGALLGIAEQRRYEAYQAWIAAEERRRGALNSLTAEIRTNRGALEEISSENARTRRVKIMPRLLTSAVDSILVSRSLDDARDRALVLVLHRWRDEALGLNQRLDLAHSKLYVMHPENNGGPAAELSVEERRLLAGRAKFAENALAVLQAVEAQLLASDS